MRGDSSKLEEGRLSLNIRKTFLIVRMVAMLTATKGCVLQRESPWPLNLWVQPY